MSKISIKGATTGTGVFTLESPATNTDRTLVLPDEAGTVLTSASTNNFPAGSVVQVQYRAIPANGFSTTSSTMVDVTNWYVDITPKFSNSILVWQAILPVNSNLAAGYARFRIVDGLNSNTQWNSNSYIGGAGFNANTTQYIETPLLHANTSGTTSPMRLQLQLLVATGGTIDMIWSGGDNRIVMVQEIAQ